jgi:acyl-CoA synthetase (AMP-forming)/AMP-acid ligase II
VTSLPEPETLSELLAAHAASIPDRTAVLFEDQRTSFAELDASARRFAAFLADRGVRAHDRVVLLLPNGSAFFFAFYGILRLGATAVPLMPRSGTERLARIATATAARAVIGTQEILRGHDEGLARLLGRERPALLDVAQGLSWPTPVACPPPAPDDLAFLQFTSGTTGASKAVQLSHRNLVRNVQSMVALGYFGASDVFVSWLPVHHDMGLILLTMLPAYVGAPCVLLPTSLNVNRWLKAVQTYHGTVTGGPDFAYRYCLKLAGGARYDLSSLRIAFNAAEPVRAPTIAAFEKKFGVGHVVRPCYGLAECSVGVTMTEVGSPVRVDGRGVVSVGRPLPGIDVAVVDGEAPLPSGTVGELVVRSPANTRGYLDDPEATAALKWGSGYVRTGDLAYLDERGEIFILGRSKNVIQIAGQTLAPMEIEHIVDELPEVRWAAALGVPGDDFVGERLVVFAEVRPAGTDAEGLAETGREIVARLHQQLGVRPGRVVLLPTGGIPRTFNGKTQYPALRAAYRDGTLQPDVLWTSAD